MPYKNSFTTITKNFKKIHHQLFNNQLFELRSSSEIDNIVQKEEAIFKKTPTVGLARDKETKEKFSGDKKKYCIKGKMDSLSILRISHHLMDCAMK